MNWRVAILLALALAQMAGDGLGIAWLKGLAAATAASPAPKVFSAVRGLETYSTRFELMWIGADGRVHRIRITPEIASRLCGPYNRRNVYGAVLAYGPVLACDPQTKPMLDAVLRYALCPPVRLFSELGLDANGISGQRVVYEPLRQNALRDLPTSIVAPCQ